MKRSIDRSKKPSENLLLASLLLPSFVYALSRLDRYFCILASLWSLSGFLGRHSCFVADYSHKHPSLHFISKKLNLLFRSFDLACFVNFHGRCRLVLCPVAPEYIIPVTTRKRIVLYFPSAGDIQALPGKQSFSKCSSFSRAKMS